MKIAINLTEDDIQTFSNDDELLEEFYLNIEIHTKGDDAKSIKAQILEDQQKAKTLSKIEKLLPSILFYLDLGSPHLVDNSGSFELCLKLKSLLKS